MRAAGPTVDPVPCSGCDKLLDPLRAGHVAIFDDKLHYFCDRAGCRAAYLAPWGGEPAHGERFEPPRPRPSRGLSAELAGPITSAKPPSTPEDVLPEPLHLDDDRALVEPLERAGAVIASPRVDGNEPRDVGVLLLLLAVVAGALAVILGTGGGGRLVLLARVVLVGVAVAMLIARALTTPRNVADAHPVPQLMAPLAALAVSAWAVLRAGPAIAGEAVSLAGAVATVCAVGSWLLEGARRGVEGERAWIEHALGAPGRRLLADGAIEDGVLDMHAGERVLVEEGEDVPVDLMLAEGEVELLPWLGATMAARRRAGEPIVAGAHVLRGRVVGTCTWSGLDRAFARVVLDPRRRLDVLVPTSQAARSLVERWSWVAALGTGALTYAISRNPFDAAMTAVATQAGLATALVGALSSVHVARGALTAQRRGITYKSGDAWDRAARASIALFCARGTLLLGEPEVAEIEAFASLSAADLLSLVAGAARAETTPTAQAILRAAKQRGVRPDAVRNPNVTAGAGVLAVTSGGEELCVGSRSFLLDQRIGIAAAEWRIGELENLGRSIQLIALGGRIVGLVALQDGIRPGARAAVQHLLDESIEPVLMSGDARETCDAIARSLDIEHVRAEIAPNDRAEEVKRLAEAGERVAVLGHPQHDEAALAAGDVSIALNAAGASSAEHDIALAGGDLRDAALSLVIARRVRAEARLGFGLVTIPPALGSLIVALGVLPPAFIPIAAFLGGVVGVFHLRTLARRSD